MDQNICHFIPFHKDIHSIHTINFVLETKLQSYDRLKSESVYKMFMEKLKICNQNFVFHQAGEVQNFREKGLYMNSKIIDLISESVLLYTFSFLGDRLLHEDKEPKQLNSIHVIKSKMGMVPTQYMKAIQSDRRGNQKSKLSKHENSCTGGFHLAFAMH